MTIIKTVWNYDRVSSFYQQIASIYSLGMIRKSKIIQLQNNMKPGKKVLYVGVGSGEDAVLGAKNGMDVTCIDISSKMIAKVKRKFEKNKLKGKFIVCDVFKHEEFRQYDYLVVNYFLNNFSPETMKIMIRHLTKLIKKDGKFLIADFMAYSKNKFIHCLQEINFLIPVCFFTLFRVTTFHRVPNYIKLLEETTLELEKIDYCCLLGLQLPLYGSIVAKIKS